MYIILSLLQNYRNLKKNFLNLKFYINIIFTPERLLLGCLEQKYWFSLPSIGQREIGTHIE